MNPMESLEIPPLGSRLSKRFSGHSIIAHMHTSDVVRAHVIAHGRVQGVFYRDTMRREAEARGVAGSAVNLPDGTVQCFFEGPREAVEEMIEVARAGSRASTVDELDVAWVDPTGATGFATG